MREAVKAALAMLAASAILWAVGPAGTDVLQDTGHPAVRGPAGG